MALQLPSGPINYGFNVQNPTESFLQSFQAGSDIRQARMEQEQAERQAKQQEVLAQAFERLRQPGATAKDYADLAMMLPETQAKAVRESFGMISADQQQNALRQSGQVFSAFKSGQPDIAINLMERQIEAKRNAGDEEGAKFLETWRDVAKQDPKAVEDYFGFSISQMPGGDKVITSAIALGGEKREQELQPFKVTEAQAQAIIKEAEAKFAPKKFGLEIDLTQSQIKQAEAARRASDAAAKASGAQAERLRAEANQIASGIIPADKRPEAEGKFRQEYSNQTKGYQEVKSAYGRVLASDETAAGDLALIFNYMKMLDPGSVVREGEFATAQNAAGVPDRVRNLANNLLRGERLNPEQRKMFAKQAENLFTQAQKQEQTVRKGIERIAQGYGLNTQNIFYEAVESVPTAPSAALAPAPAGGPRRPAASPAASQVDALLELYLGRPQ
jgi:hypothetical protein